MGGSGEEAVEQRGDTDLRRIVQRRAVLEHGGAEGGVLGGVVEGAEGWLGRVVEEGISGGSEESSLRARGSFMTREESGATHHWPRIYDIDHA